MKIKAWEKAWRSTWTAAYHSGAAPLSNAATIVGKKVKAANDNKYIEA